MKRIFLILSVLLLGLIFAPTAFAQDNVTDEEQLETIISDIDQNLEQSIDNDLQKELDENGIDGKDYESISNFSLGGLLGYIWQVFISFINKPFAIIGKITALALICLLVKNLSPDNYKINKAFTLAAVLCSVIICLDAITTAAQKVISSLEVINAFMLSYIPVYAGVLAAGGAPTAATSYYLTLFAAGEVITYIADKIFMPLIGITFAISIVAAINPTLSISFAASSISSLVRWLLGGLMTIFVGILSVQTAIGVSGDSVAIKAARFAVSTFVPVVGGAVSDAYQTVRGSLGVIRSGVGGFGVIVLLFIVIKPVVFAFVMKLTVTISAVITDILGEKELSSLLKSTSQTISIALSVIITVGVVFILSTTVLMLAGLAGD